MVSRNINDRFASIDQPLAVLREVLGR